MSMGSVCTIVETVRLLLLEDQAIQPIPSNVYIYANICYNVSNFNYGILSYFADV